MHNPTQEIYIRTKCFHGFHIFAFSHFSCMKIPKNQFTFFTRFPCPFSTFPCPMTHVFTQQVFLKLAINTTMNSCFRAFREMEFRTTSHENQSMYVFSHLIRFHVSYFPNPRNGVDHSYPENQPSEKPATPSQHMYRYLSNSKHQERRGCGSSISISRSFRS